MLPPNPLLIDTLKPTQQTPVAPVAVPYNSVRRGILATPSAILHAPASEKIIITPLASPKTPIYGLPDINLTINPDLTEEETVDTASRTQTHGLSAIQNIDTQITSPSGYPNWQNAISAAESSGRNTPITLFDRYGPSRFYFNQTLPSAPQEGILTVTPNYAYSRFYADPNDTASGHLYPGLAALAYDTDIRFIARRTRRLTRYTDPSGNTRYRVSGQNLLTVIQRNQNILLFPRLLFDSSGSYASLQSTPFMLAWHIKVKGGAKGRETTLLPRQIRSALTGGIVTVPIDKGYPWTNELGRPTSDPDRRSIAVSRPNTSSAVTLSPHPWDDARFAPSVTLPPLQGVANSPGDDTYLVWSDTAYYSGTALQLGGTGPLHILAADLSTLVQSLRTALYTVFSSSSGAYIPPDGGTLSSDGGTVDEYLHVEITLAAVPNTIPHTGLHPV